MKGYAKLHLIIMEFQLEDRLASLSTSAPHDPELRRKAYIDYFREYLRTEKERIFTRHLSGASGAEILSSHTNLIDTLIQAVYKIVSEEQIGEGKPVEPLAILAAGGYGRRELQPHSDIDILFLFPKELTESIGQLATAILHYLWDIGFELGHSLRSIEDCLRYAREDLTSQTSMMESRFIAGDLATFAQLESSLNNTVFRDMVSSYVRGKYRELQERHQHYGDSIYNLEPNVKNGVGGLRDIHTALWIAQARFGTRQLSGLHKLGVISETERVQTEKSLDFLWRVRNDLHYRAARKQDILSLQYQEIVATDLGFTNDLLGTAVELFMQAYYRAARNIYEYSMIFIDRCFPPHSRKTGHRQTQITIVPGIFQRDGAIHLLETHVQMVDAPLIMRCFLESQRRNVPLAVGTKTLIRNRISKFSMEDFLLSDARNAFLDMLVETGNLGLALRAMHELGVLEKFIPEFEGLTCLVRQDIQHRYTVDEHTLQLVDFLQELKNQTTLDRNNGQPPPKELIQVYHEVKADRLLMLAALLHDIGKVSKEEHVQAGLKMIPAILDRLKIYDEERELILFLVEEHLLMSEVTQHHDLEDNRVLSNFAWEINNTNKLKLLYCLTYADMRAVGPEIWTPWKASLLSELYRKTKALLSGEKLTEVDEADEVNAVRKSMINRFKKEVSAEEVNEHFSKMSLRYLLGTAPVNMVKHIQLVRELHSRPAFLQKKIMKEESISDNAEEQMPPFFTSYTLQTSSPVDAMYPLITSVTHFPKIGYSDYTICTLDMPGLFSKIAGTLASKGISILSAQIFTRSDGIVIDTLQLDHRSPGWTDENQVWVEIEMDLHKVLAGEKDISIILSYRQKGFTPSVVVSSHVPTEISISTEISDTQTVIDIRTQDRIGLLYTLTHTLAQLNLTIGTARIATYGFRAVDVFYVTDTEGEKVTDPLQLAKIQSTLEFALTHHH